MRPNVRNNKRWHRPFVCPCRTQYTHIFTKKFQYNICQICICSTAFASTMAKICFLPGKYTFSSGIENRTYWSPLLRTNNKSLARAKFVLGPCFLATASHHFEHTINYSSRACVCVWAVWFRLRRIQINFSLFYERI